MITKVKTGQPFRTNNRGTVHRMSGVGPLSRDISGSPKSGVAEPRVNADS